jgi:hypothetical protein
VVLSWVEHFCRRIDAPPVAGFGGELARNTVVRQFHETPDHEWRPDDQVVTITIPIDNYRPERPIDTM